GHQKPMCDLAVKIIRQRPVYVTILVGDKLLDVVQKQVSSQVNQRNELRLLSQIRVAGIDCGESGFDSDSTNKAFSSAFKTLIAGKPLSRRPGCSTEYSALPPPRLVVLDLLGYEALQIVRSMSKRRIKILALQSSMAAQIFLISGPKELGGRGDFAAELEREAKTVDLDRQGIIKVAQQRTDGKLIGGAGLPPMHDYEVYPQMSVFGDKVSIAYMARYMHRLFSECDGVILNTSFSVEPHAISAWKNWLRFRPVFVLGPLAPAIEPNIQREQGQRFSHKVQGFLDEALEKFGENSVVYMSFGTVFWTTEPEKIWAFFDALIALNTPFVFAYASPVATVPDDVQTRVNESGLGFISKWVPQHLILHHQATGWFLSHCGQNSTLESLMEGVPMICWPFRGDQPCNAINLTVNLNVAYELFEVRNGEHGLAPLLRLGEKSPSGAVDAVYHEAIEVIKKTKGEDGFMKRRNALRIRSEIDESWKGNGVCTSELVRMLDFAGLNRNVSSL
ncbi:UDP-Glycosyltransferase/glycogen phosphorylase, partial [Phellopilus nigrolimitatus]